MELININSISHGSLSTEQGKQQAFLHNFSTTTETMTLADMLDSDTDTWEALIDKLQHHMARTLSNKMCQTSYHAQLAASNITSKIPDVSINNANLADWKVEHALWNAGSNEEHFIILDRRCKAMKKLPVSDAIVKSIQMNSLYKHNQSN